MQRDLKIDLGQHLGQQIDHCQNVGHAVAQDFFAFCGGERPAAPNSFLQLGLALAVERRWQVEVNQRAVQAAAFQDYASVGDAAKLRIEIDYVDRQRPA